MIQTALLLLLSATSLLNQVKDNPSVTPEFQQQAYTVALQAITFSQSVLADISNSSISTTQNIGSVNTVPITPTTQPQQTTQNTEIVNTVNVPNTPNTIISEPDITMIKYVPATYADTNDNGIRDIGENTINNRAERTYRLTFKTSQPTTALWSVSGYPSIKMDSSTDFVAELLDTSSNTLTYTVDIYGIGKIYSGKIVPSIPN